MRRNPHIVRGLRAAGFQRRLARRGRALIRGNASQAAPVRTPPLARSTASRRAAFPACLAALGSCLALCAALAAGLAACGGAREPGKTQIRFWAMGREGEVVTELVRDFERENPAIEVQVQQIPWSAAHEKLLTAHVGGSTPDLAQLGNTWVSEFAALHALEPLDALGRGRRRRCRRPVTSRASGTRT